MPGTAQLVGWLVTRSRKIVIIEEFSMSLDSLPLVQVKSGVSYLCMSPGLDD